MAANHRTGSHCTSAVATIVALAAPPKRTHDAPPEI